MSSMDDGEGTHHTDEDDDNRVTQSVKVPSDSAGPPADTARESAQSGADAETSGANAGASGDGGYGHDGDDDSGVIPNPYDLSQTDPVDLKKASPEEVFNYEELAIIDRLFPSTGSGSASDPVDFFTAYDGQRTLAGPSDIPPALPNDIDSTVLRPMAAYWVDQRRDEDDQVIQGLAFVLVYMSTTDQSLHYVVVEPDLSSQLEADREALRRQVINNDPAGFNPNASAEERATEIQRELNSILTDLNLVEGWVPNQGVFDRALNAVSDLIWKVLTTASRADQSDKLTAREQAILTYYLTRDFAFYDRINPIMEDPNIEDISCDAPGTPVYVDHATFGEGIPSNVVFDDDDSLKTFIVRLAQKVGKDVSESSPMVEATLPDGSRAHLTYGSEVSAEGSNFTLRLFSEVPFTPRDLICWETYDFERAAYLWLILETGHSVIFSGDTGAGKTTSLNAFSMFIPIDKKIVSIEDTRELEIPHRNWVASVTRESTGGNRTDIDESGLVKAALRQRPAFIIMGEVRGEEGQDMVNAMNTGHYTLGTFHAGDDQSLINRFVQDKIGADKTGLGELDVIVQQKMFEPGNDQFRRNTQIVEIDRFKANEQRYRAHETFSYHRGTDSWRPRSRSIHLEQVREDSDWTSEELEREVDRRAAVLAYLVQNGIKSYRGVSAVIQAYMREGGKKRVLRLMAEERLEDEISTLIRSMSRHIDVATATDDESTDRPKPSAALKAQAATILQRNTDLITPHAHRSVTPDWGRAVEGWDDPVRDPPPGATGANARSQAFSLHPTDDQTHEGPPEDETEIETKTEADGSSTSGGDGVGSAVTSLEAQTKTAEVEPNFTQASRQGATTETRRETETQTDTETGTSASMRADANEQNLRGDKNSTSPIFGDTDESVNPDEADRVGTLDSERSDESDSDSDSSIGSGPDSDSSLDSGSDAPEEATSDWSWGENLDSGDDSLGNEDRSVESRNGEDLDDHRVGQEVNAEAATDPDGILTSDVPETVSLKTGGINIVGGIDEDSILKKLRPSEADSDAADDTASSSEANDGVKAEMEAEGDAGDFVPGKDGQEEEIIDNIKSVGDTTKSRSQPQDLEEDESK